MSYESCAVPEELFAKMKEIVTPAGDGSRLYLPMYKQVREENIRQVTAKLEEAFADKEDWLAILPMRLYTSIRRRQFVR